MVQADAMDLSDDVLTELLASPERRLVGIVGPPASGKSHLAMALVEALNARQPGAAARLAMDGFHFANSVLLALGKRERKGAPDTFDVDGFVAILHRVRSRRDPVVYAPEFVREIEEPVANTIPIPQTASVIVVEGNYLLLDVDPWAAVRPLLDEVWYVETPESVRYERLMTRQLATYGTREAAAAWVESVDLPNARLIEATASRASKRVVGQTESENQ
jgi:pantothenate kinase